MKTLIIALAFSLFASTSCLADGPTSSLDNIEVAFIYFFTTYIEWPNESASTTEDFNIFVLGKTSTLAALKELAEKKTIKGRKIIIIEGTKFNISTKIDILVSANTAETAVNDALKAIKNSPVLTIDLNGGPACGQAIIDLYELKGKVNFKINRSVAEAKGFKISAQLLKLAAP